MAKERTKMNGVIAKNSKFLSVNVVSTCPLPQYIQANNDFLEFGAFFPASWLHHDHNNNSNNVKPTHKPILNCSSLQQKNIVKDFNVSILSDADYSNAESTFSMGHTIQE